MSESHQGNLSNYAEWRGGGEGVAMLSHPSYRFLRNTLGVFALVSVLTILGQIARMIALFVSSLFG